MSSDYDVGHSLVSNPSRFYILLTQLLGLRTRSMGLVFDLPWV